MLKLQSIKSLGIRRRNFSFGAKPVGGKAVEWGVVFGVTLKANAFSMDFIPLYSRVWLKQYKWLQVSASSSHTAVWG